MRDPLQPFAYWISVIQAALQGLAIGQWANVVALNQPNYITATVQQVDVKEGYNERVGVKWA